MVDAGYFQPVALWIYHAPPGQIIQRSSPQHGFFAASVHGNVAADAGGISRGGVNGKDVARCLGRLGNASINHSGLGFYGCYRCVHPGQIGVLHRTHLLELFGIYDHTMRTERDRTASVASAPAAWDDGQMQLEAGSYQGADLGLGIRGEYYKGISYSPVGGISDMGDT